MDVAKQYCKGCQTNRALDAFENGFLSCNKCREKGRNRYQRNQDYYLNYSKQYHQNHPEKIKEAKTKYRDKFVLCEVCDYQIALCNKSRHEQTKYHQDRLRSQQQSVEPKILTNQNLLDSQYALTENYLCCDE